MRELFLKAVSVQPELAKHRSKTYTYREIFSFCKLSRGQMASPEQQNRRRPSSSKFSYTEEPLVFGKKTIVKAKINLRGIFHVVRSRFVRGMFSHGVEKFCACNLC